MTVAVQDTKFQHVGNGITTVFAFNCKIISADDLVVSLDDVQVFTGFTVAGIGIDAGGTVTFDTPPAVNAKVTLDRIVKLSRLIDYQQTGDFLAKVVNPDFDRVWMALQQIETELGLQPNAISRVLLLGRSDTNGSGAYQALQNRIKDLGDPIAQQDAANRRWVETEIGRLLTNGAGQYVLDLLSASTGATRIGRGAGTIDGALTVVEAVAAKYTATRPRSRTSPPVFIEQHLTSFFGRGMLTAETINVTTEQALAANAIVGAATLTATNATNFVVGGCVTVKHDNGKYGTYYVDSKSSNNIGIRPSLRYACTTGTARIERTWYNRAHPGKFYMRELAQRIANLTELDGAMPNGKRVLFTNVSSSPNTLEDTLTAIGGAAVNYFAADNIGDSGTTSTPVRFALGRTALVDSITAASAGVETQSFDVYDAANVIVKVSFLSSGTASQFSIQVFDELDIERGKYGIPLYPNSGVMQTYTFPADVRRAKRIRVRVACEFYTAPGGYFVVDQIDVFEAPSEVGKVITHPDAKIVCLGDSWIQGDLGSTPEREPITTQLALELPNATIINAGVGGNTVTNELARFDTDVTPYAPDYVVINTGTNESYNPLSATFDPNAIDAFIETYRRIINKIRSIGARPIIIGVPALAQSDADVPALPEWTLNNRAKAYAKRVFEEQGSLPSVMSGSSANGSWTKLRDGTLICRHSITVTTTAGNTLASVAWTFPKQFIAAPKVTTSPSTYNTNQIVASGINGATATAVAICLVTGSSGAAMPIDCIAVGRWY